MEFKDKLIRELAIKYNLPIVVIESIVLEPFKMLHEHMSTTELSNATSFKNFHLFRFGNFWISDKKKRYLEYNYEKFRKKESTTELC